MNHDHHLTAAQLERGAALVRRAHATDDRVLRGPILNEIIGVLDGFGHELPYGTPLSELEQVLATLSHDLVRRPESHDGHEIIAASGRRQNGEMVGWLACVDCQAILQPVPICGQPTLKGRPCRTPIRTDLGYDRCWSHGEGAGRTSTPRRARRAN